MALTPEQKSSRLFKKALGAGETLLARDFFEEPKLGKSLVFTEQIWTQSDDIPTIAPILAPNATSGVVQYIEKLTLTHVPGSLNLAYFSENLKDAIPFNHDPDGSYFYKLYKNDDSQIAFGQGDWLVDETAGVLTFYGTLPAGVTAASPPKITFYKYIGDKGIPDASGTGFNIKDPVLVASTTNISGYDSGLSGFTTVPDIDGISGVTFNDGDRILIKDQIDPIENGIYVVTGSTLERADAIVGVGDYVFVEDGDTNIASSWVLNDTDAIEDDQIISGVNTQIWVLFARSAAYEAGQGLTLTGQEFDVNVDGQTIVINLDNELEISNSVMTVISDVSTDLSELEVLVGEISSDVVDLSGLTTDISEALSTEISDRVVAVESLEDLIDGLTGLTAGLSSLETLVSEISTDVNILSGLTSDISNDLSIEIETRESEALTYLKLSGGTMSGNLDMGSNQILLSTMPTQADHVANKEYVDALALGLIPHAPVKVVSTDNIIRSGLTIIDDYQLEEGDRVLVAGQDDLWENGIFVASGDTWSRAEDADGNPNNEISVGDFVYVKSGSTFASSGWVLSRTDATDKHLITPEVDTQEWFQITAPGSYKADEQGLKLIGNEFFIDLDGNTLTQSASGLKLNDTLSTEISSNTSNLLVLSTDVSSLETVVGDISSDLVDLSIEVSGLTTDLSLLESVVDGVSSELSELSTDVSILSGLTSDISDQVVVNTSNINELSGLTTDLSIELESLSGLTGGLSSLETLIGEVSTDLSSLETRVSNLEDSVEDLSGLTYDISDELSIETVARISGDESLEALIAELSGATIDIETILGEGQLLGLVGGELTGVTNIQPQLSADLSSLEVVVESVSSELVSLESVVSLLESDVSDLSGLTSAVSDQVVINSDSISSLEEAFNNFSGVTEDTAGNGLSYDSLTQSLNVNVDGVTIKISGDTLIGTREWWQDTDQADVTGTSGSTGLVLTYDPVTPVNAYINGISYFVNPGTSPDTKRPFFYNEFPPQQGTEIWFDPATAGFDLELTVDTVSIRYLIVEDF